MTNPLPGREGIRQAGMDGLYERAKPLAGKVMDYARDSILVNMRFLDVAVSALTREPREGTGNFAADGSRIYYDPVFLLRNYQAEPAFAIRMYLHILFHLIFFHSFRYDKLEREYWNLAADIAVEAAILELQIPGISLGRDEKKEAKLRVIQEDIHSLTAEKVYRYLKNFGVSRREVQELSELFFMDSHEYWQEQEKLELSLEQWQKLSRRVQADLKSFSAGKTKSESMEQNLTEATRERYNYGELLRRFAVLNEDLQVNEEEFDYIYYTYGLARYGNMPLVEPLEYKDARKVREFVIAIDTSASCRGELVASFLRRTCELLSGEENFFRKMNVHIIQCDHQVQKDTKITGKDDLSYFLEHEKLTGFGSTDFGPVFAYVEELLQAGEFENLKGLIYFTDGYGVYPQRMPAYEVMFVFLDNGDTNVEVPPWAMKVILDEEELGKNPAVKEPYEY